MFPRDPKRFIPTTLDLFENPRFLVAESDKTEKASPPCPDPLWRVLELLTFRCLFLGKYMFFAVVLFLEKYGATNK